MPVSLKCTAVDIQANGSRNVTFDDGISLDFPTLAELQEYASGVETLETARKFLLARYIAADRDGSDTAALLNRTASINAGAPSPVQIG